MSYGKVLREARLSKGLSIRKLARASGVSATYISRIEREDTVPPSTVVSAKLASALKIDIYSLTRHSGRIPDDVISLLKAFPDELIPVIREKGTACGNLQSEGETIKIQTER